jgi:sugar phosphate isomerase/epimerase
MKLAFSTLACPGWSEQQVAQAAADLGYDAVEMRLLGGEVIDPLSDRTRVRQAVGMCRALGVEVCAFDTSCTFNHVDAAERLRQVATLLQWIDLAAAEQVQVLRVFAGQGQAGAGAGPSSQTIVGWVADSLREAAPAAEQAGVTIALETHDSFCSSRALAQALDAAGSPRVAALWDSHHPYRVGESNEAVIANLWPRIAHVHVKDARRDECESSGWKLVLLGEGEVPVSSMLRLLAEHGYTGYASVEWEKRWHPELAEPEVALKQHIGWLRAAGF